MPRETIYRAALETIVRTSSGVDCVSVSATDERALALRVMWLEAILVSVRTVASVALDTADVVAISRDLPFCD